jgi:hypothetical protein
VKVLKELGGIAIFLVMLPFLFSAFIARIATESVLIGWAGGIDFLRWIYKKRA